MTQSAVELRGVEFAYGERGFRLRVDALQIAPGERVACIGPSGTGKTTLVNLLAGVAVPDRGTVRAATGEPIPGAWIQLYPLELMSGKRMTRNAKAGAQGEYEFVHLPPGDYELRRMESSVGAEGKSLWSHSQIVTIEGREPVEVDLRSGGSAVVRGTIESSVPVPLLAYVRLVPVLATGPQFDTTRASRWGRAHNGRFEFEEVEPGAYELRAEFDVAERARGARGPVFLTSW